VKGGDPFGAVLGPQNYAIGGTDLFAGEECGETAGLPGNIAVGGNAPPVALVANYSDLAAVTAEVLNKCGQIVSHEWSGWIYGSSVRKAYLRVGTFKNADIDSNMEVRGFPP
jgi:hypothetical protein